LLSQGQEETFEATITGEKTWHLRYGFGSPHGLAQAGMAPNQLHLDQSLAVNITGKALSFLTINAQFDDQKPMNMQSLTVDLDAGDLQGTFGDFPISQQDTFLAYNKELRGIRLDYQIGKAQLSGILSQVEGISESKTFVGRTAHEEMTFSLYSPEQPWVRQPYLLNLQGLYHFELEEPFIEGFSIATIDFVANQALNSHLIAYGLGYLFEDITKSPSQDLSRTRFSAESKTSSSSRASRKSCCEGGYRSTSDNTTRRHSLMIRKRSAIHSLSEVTMNKPFLINLCLSVI
jgi:hypothetical protein